MELLKNRGQGELPEHNMEFGELSASNFAIMALLSVMEDEDDGYESGADFPNIPFGD